MLTAGQITFEAGRIAKVPNYATDQLNLLNSILSDLCQFLDLAICRGLFSFNFNPGLTSNFGSGPYLLPVDYLRVSGSSGESQKGSFWTLQGVPYPMVPCDLSEFDMQVQQAGLQSYPWLWATDLANASQATSSRYKAIFTLATTASSTAATAATGLNIAVGDGIAGEAIVPGTTITGYTPGTGAMTLSAPATGTLSAASCFSGVPPQGFAYPPPSGAYAVTIRYQRQMPPIVDLAKVPWFPDEGYLITALAGRLMEISDDSRTVEFIGDGRMDGGRAGRRLREFLGNTDDKRSRPQTVELDRRRFGPALRVLRNTKQVGW